MVTLLSVLYFSAIAAQNENSSSSLFPTDLPHRDWVHFKAAGFSEPACGVIYRLHDPVTNGMALGGIDTGCLDLETSGLLGYCTLFNTHIPRRGPINMPILGLSTGGETWVLCDPTQIKQGWGGYQGGSDGKPIPPAWNDLHLDAVHTVKEIHYWGHYPVADLEFDTGAPVSVGLRAWAPFLPGDVAASTMPAIVFEVHLRNGSDAAQKGTIAFSFPGPTAEEAGTKTFSRQAIDGSTSGVSVQGKRAAYALSVLGGRHIRTGAGLGGDGTLWKNIAQSLPAATAEDAGASIASEFNLAPKSSSVMRFILTWCAPEWNGAGRNDATAIPNGYSGELRTFTHMYAKHYPDPVKTGHTMAAQHKDLLKRVLAWQQVVYTENRLPVWLRDSLVNVLYLITEDGLWAQAKPPLPEWVREDDGLFGMNECPRGCPQIECIPCSFYGSLPLTYFFPELALSTLRGYKGYQFDDGAPTWIFGGCTGRTPYIDFAYPTRGYQFVTNGISLSAIANWFVMCRDTADRQYLHEFYPMVKRCMTWTAGLRTTPEYAAGERLIAMPDKNEGTEWFEAAEPGWCGMTAHVGGLHIAQLRIVERMAQAVGDTEFAAQCGQWIQAAQEAMDKRLWTGSYYLNYFEPETGRKSDFVFGYQLDGQWITDHHGLPPTLPDDRIHTVLETIKRCNVGLTKYGAVNYANPDGSAIPSAKPGTWDYGRFSYFPPEALMLAMTYMYQGQAEFGVELARRVWHNLVCLQGYTWDLPNIMRGDTDTGERTFGNDYYQDMMLWSLPAALEGRDLSVPTKPGGLVERMLQAAQGK